MGTIIAKLVEKHDTFYEGDWVCDGCWNAFQFALSLSYKQASADDSEGEATGT